MIYKGHCLCRTTLLEEVSSNRNLLKKFQYITGDGDGVKQCIVNTVGQKNNLAATDCASYRERSVNYLNTFYDFKIV